MKKRLHIFGLSWSLKEVVVLSAIIVILILLVISCIFLPDVWENPYIIPIAALIVASIAAIGTLISLKLTRDTIRPFLYMAESIKIRGLRKYRTMVFNIKNSGSLPAEDVNVAIHFFGEDEKVTEENSSSRYRPPKAKSAPTIVFPNSDYYQNYVLDLEKAKESELWNNIIRGKIKCRVRIIYSSLGRKHTTIQTKAVVKREAEEDVVVKAIPPQKWT
jgi:hypothetical protein